MTSNLRLYAAPVALLVMATALAVPKASAETGRRGETISATITYDRHASAERVYEQIETAAERLCATTGQRPLFVLQLERACVASVMQDAIGKIGRVDIADLHNRARG
jgi:UrcA family protein